MSMHALCSTATPCSNCIIHVLSSTEHFYKNSLHLSVVSVLYTHIVIIFTTFALTRLMHSIFWRRLLQVPQLGMPTSS